MEDIQSKSFEVLTEKYGQYLRVPRRPPKDSYSNAEELEAAENKMFIGWKRGLAHLTEVRRESKIICLFLGRWCSVDSI